MNLRTSVAALTLALGSLVSVPAFAQSAPCNTGALPRPGQDGCPVRTAVRRKKTP